jgi:hypothetical protein
MSATTPKYKKGDKVILGEHQTQDAQGNKIAKNWNKDMGPFVGKEATIVGHYYVDAFGINLYHVDIDNGMWTWREVNMIPVVDQAKVATPQSYGAKCNKCGDWNEYVPATKDFICYGCKH